VLGHSFFEYLLEDDLHALAHSGFHVQFDVVFEVVSRGQVPPFSLETHNLPDTIGKVCTPSNEKRRIV
jgi:hypothetical protein